MNTTLEYRTKRRGTNSPDAAKRQQGQHSWTKESHWIRRYRIDDRHRNEKDAKFSAIEHLDTARQVKKQTLSVAAPEVSMLTLKCKYSRSKSQYATRHESGKPTRSVMTHRKIGYSWYDRWDTKRRRRQGWKLPWTRGQRRG
jgi:hypothetical protein